MEHTKTLHMIFEILKQMKKQAHVTRTKYTDTGTEAVIEYEGIFYKISVSPMNREP